MTGFALRKISSAMLDGPGRTGSAVRSGLLTGFVLGLLFGFLVGLSSGKESFVPGSGITGGALGSAWMFFLLLFIFSTSYLGLVLIPALMFVRGAVFSCSVTVLYFSLGTDGLLLALLASALPMCIFLPLYVLVGEDCFRLSRRLAQLHMGRGGYCGTFFPLRHLLLVFFAILAEAAYSAYLLPWLTSVLI